MKVLDGQGKNVLSAPAGSRENADELGRRLSTMDSAYVWDAKVLKIVSIWKNGRRIDAPVQMDLGLPVEVVRPANLERLDFTAENAENTERKFL